MSGADVSPGTPERQSRPPVPPSDGAERRRGFDRRLASGSFAAIPVAARYNPMRGLGVYAVLFGGIFLLLLITVILEDAALQASYDSQASRDAQAMATAVETGVGSRLAALRSLRGLYLEDAAQPPDTRRLARLLPFAQPARLFDHLRIYDTTGTALLDTALTANVLQPRLDAELTRITHPTAEGGASRRVRIFPLRETPGEVALVVPLVVDTQTVAVAVGTFRMRDVVARVVGDAVPRRLGLAVLAGPDTVFSNGAWQEGVEPYEAPVSVPAAAPWRAVAVHEETSPGGRTTLWLLGAAAVVFLVIGFFRERRQAERLAERTSELERLSAELLRSNRMKSEFLANISHELRTPLNAIVGFAELLRDGVYGELSPRQTNPVDRIAGSATHLRHLVDQVLDIAKMAAGRLEVHLEAVVLRPFVLNVASELESLAADKGIVFSLTVGASLPRVRTDPSHLRQILVNLVGNAIKYTASGGAVAIRTRLIGTPPMSSWRTATPPPGLPPRPVTSATGRTPEDEPAPTALASRAPDPAKPWVAILVSDTGIGIAPEDQERIFEEFEQVNAGPRGESMQRGTGLGLPISRRLARLLGGDITVDSEVGRGATFILWLPLEDAAAGG